MCFFLNIWYCYLNITDEILRMMKIGKKKKMCQFKYLYIKFNWNHQITHNKKTTLKITIIHIHLIKKKSILFLK